MHILIVSSGYPNSYEPLDGIFYRDQALALKEAGNKVGVISSIPISFFSVLKVRKIVFGKNFKIDQDIPTYTWSYLNIPKQPKFPVAMALKKGMKLFHEYILKYGKPDLLHLHCFEGGKFAMQVKNTFNIPFVITEHSSRFLLNTNPEVLEPIIQKVFTNADERIAVSNSLKEILEKKYNLPFSYIPNIVDLEAFNVDFKIRKNELFTYVNVAGLNENKNHKMLLDAFKLVLDSGINAQLKIAGDGPLFQILREHASKLNIEKQVKFLGFQSRQALKELYNESHVFVLASKKETFGVVIIEALSCGMPVVATKCGGPESIIVDDKLGELAEITTEGISNTMQRVFHKFISFNPSQIHQYASENFSSKSVASSLMKMYDALLTKDKNE